MREKLQERKRAEQLRRQGLSYYEIMEIVPVSIASLSLWLHGIKLKPHQQKRLDKRKLRGQQAGARRRRQQRLEGIEKIDEEIRKQSKDFLADSFFIMGLSLYWAEGTKQNPWSVSSTAVFTNSDPLLVKLMRNWFKKYFLINSERFGYRLHIHESANVDRAIKEWAKILKISPNEIKVTIKKHLVKTRHVREDYRGLIQLRVYNGVLLNRRIGRWTLLAAEYFLRQ